MIGTIWRDASTVTKKKERISTAIRATPVDEKIDGVIGKWGDGVNIIFSVAPYLLISPNLGNEIEQV